MFKKGQVSTEYLIILAVVLVIAFVVVLLVSSSTGQAQTATESQSKAYWAAASPFAVTGAKASATTLQLSVKNQDLQKLTLTSVSGSGVTTGAFSTDFASGQEQVISVTLAATCGSAGTAYEYSNVTLGYTKGSLTGLVQVGARPLVGKCS